MSIDRSVAPDVLDFGRLNIESAYTISTKNGVRINIIEKGEEDVCMLNLLLPYGDMEAPSSEIMKLLTSTWREGTRNFTSDEIADKLDFYGAWMEISSSLHYTVVTLYCLSSRLGELLPLIADILLNPLFSNEPVERMKAKMISSLRINRDKVMVRAKEQMRRQLLGKGHPAAQVQTEEGINRITDEDLRTVHKKIVSLKPSIIIAGKFDVETIESVKVFAENIICENQPDIERNIVVPEPDFEHKIVRKNIPDKEQSAVIMSFPSITRGDADYNDLRITVILLGGYFGSRLMSNIREEKGYTYGISASLVGNNEIGYVTIECECDNAYVDEVISETKKELKRLINEPVSQEEINIVRRIIKSSLASMQSDTFETAGYYIGQLTIGYPENYFSEQQESLDSISPERIMEVAAKYLNPDDMFITIAGSV